MQPYAAALPRELPWVEEENDSVANTWSFFSSNGAASATAASLPIPVERTGGQLSLSSNAVQKYPMCDVHCGFATIMYKGNHSMTVGLPTSAQKMTLF